MSPGRCVEIFLKRNAKWYLNRNAKLFQNNSAKVSVFQFPNRDKVMTHFTHT